MRSIAREQLSHLTLVESEMGVVFPSFDIPSSCCPFSLLFFYFYSSSPPIGCAAVVLTSGDLDFGAFRSRAPGTETGKYECCSSVCFCRGRIG